MQRMSKYSLNLRMLIIIFLVIAVVILYGGEVIILKFFDQSNIFYKYKSIVDYKLPITANYGVDVIGVISNFVLGFYFITIDLEATKRMPKSILRFEDTFYWLMRAVLLSLILSIYAVLPLTDIQKLITSVVIVSGFYVIVSISFICIYKCKATQ